jgi:Cu(I)/Ag(I) efflux system protein CusF
MKTIKIATLLLSLIAAGSGSASAAGMDGMPGMSGMSPANPQKAAAPTDFTEGEVRTVNKDAGKITLKHGEIKNLDMPGMTMVFGVKDKSLLDKVQTGDKVKFKAVSESGKLIVTEIQSNK